MSSQIHSYCLFSGVRAYFAVKSVINLTYKEYYVLMHPTKIWQYMNLECGC